MSVYSSIDVYPSIFDDVDLSVCDDCTFDCDIYHVCAATARETDFTKKDLTIRYDYEYALTNIFEDKGYSIVNTDYCFHNGKLRHCLVMTSDNSNRFQKNMENMGYNVEVARHPHKKYQRLVFINDGTNPLNLLDVFPTLEVIK